MYIFFFSSLKVCYGVVLYLKLNCVVYIVYLSWWDLDFFLLNIDIYCI